MTDPKSKPAPKPEAPLPSIQELLDRTRMLTAQDNKVHTVLEQIAQPNGAPVSFQDLFDNPATGGLLIGGQHFPKLEGLAAEELNLELLKGPARKLQVGKKALHRALAAMEKAETDFNKRTLARTLALIRKTKGGNKEVKGFRQTMQVQDLNLFPVGDSTNRLTFGTSGTQIVVGTRIPAQYTDLTAELSVLGKEVSLISITKLLKEAINAQVALLLEHGTVISMGIGVDPDKIKRSISVVAYLWAKPGEATSYRQYNMRLTREGKTSKWTEVQETEHMFEGARPEQVMFKITLEYGIRVARGDVDATIQALGYLPELPAYRGLDADTTPADQEDEEQEMLSDAEDELLAQAEAELEAELGQQLAEEDESMSDEQVAKLNASLAGAAGGQGATPVTPSPLVEPEPVLVAPVLATAPDTSEAEPVVVAGAEPITSPSEGPDEGDTVLDLETAVAQPVTVPAEPEADPLDTPLF